MDSHNAFFLPVNRCCGVYAFTVTLLIMWMAMIVPPTCASTLAYSPAEKTAYTTTKSPLSAVDCSFSSKSANHLNNNLPHCSSCTVSAPHATALPIIAIGNIFSSIQMPYPVDSSIPTVSSPHHKRLPAEIQFCRLRE